MKKKKEPYSKGFCASQMTFYAVTWAEIRKVAFDHGYALALHGSLSRDLDVVAIPWIEKASDPKTLTKSICEKVGGFIPPFKGHQPTLKPHGRKVWTIHFGGVSAEFRSTEIPTYIDLSVMPKQRKQKGSK